MPLSRYMFCFWYILLLGQDTPVFSPLSGISNPSLYASSGELPSVSVCQEDCMCQALEAGVPSAIGFLAWV